MSGGDVPARSAHTYKGLRCLSCGYRLQALTIERCPECGGRFDPNFIGSSPQCEQRERRFLRWMGVTPGAALLALNIWLLIAHPTWFACSATILVTMVLLITLHRARA